MADYAHTETDRILSKMEKEVEKVYKEAVGDLQKKLDNYLKKFEVKDKIKRQQLEKGEITKAQYDYWRTGQILMGERWQEMRDTLARDLSNSNQIAASIVNGYLPEVYALNYNYGTYEAEKGAMVDTSYTLYDRDTVERLIKDNPQLLPEAKVNIPKDQRWNQKKITSAVTQGILQGEGIREIAKRMQRVSDMNRNQAITNARTMTTSAENAGRINSYKRAESMGIKMKKVWLATLDGRTRSSHRNLDGEKVDVDESFSNKCRYPGDPQGPAWEVYNCRCTLIAQVDGVDLDLSDVSLRNNYKLGGMSYKEWKGIQNTPSKGIPKSVYSKVTASSASDDWFKYENASFMSDYIRTGEMSETNMYSMKMSDDLRYTLAAEAEIMQNTATNTKTEYKTLYRGMVLDEDEVRKMFTPKETYTFDTLTATAVDEKLAKVYMDVDNAGGEGVPVLIEIQKPDGVFGFDRDGSEVVIPKGSEFKVYRNYMDENGVVHISLYSKKGNNINKG